MTGWISDQKPEYKTASTESVKSSEMEGKKSHLLVGVVTCFVSLVVFSAVVVSLYFGTHTCIARDMKTEQHEKRFVRISDIPTEARVEIRKAERVIITQTVSSDAKLDKTITLQDFNRDLQAVRDFSINQCLVLPIYYSFEDALKVATDNSSRPNANHEKVYLKMKRTGEPIPAELLQHAVGDNIAAFCSDLPTYWMVHDSPQDLHRLTRALGITVTVRIGTFEITFSF